MAGREQSEFAPLNELELTSVCALVSYAAYRRNLSEVCIRKTVEENFGVDDLTKLSRGDYDDVIRFLVDTQIEIVSN